uniref:RRM domain-containing protein n=1 Tax=Plectus sambesii TaxID=2011161 RepID=A0A914X6Q2_9BILA
MAGDLTKSNDPRLVASRIFIGNLPTDRCTKDDIQDYFGQHGEILGISVYKGFGFVQFKEIGDAQQAVEREHQQMFFGNILDIRLASEGRKQKPMSTYDNRPYTSREPHYTPRTPPMMEYGANDSFERIPGGGPPPTFYPPPTSDMSAGNFPGGRLPPKVTPKSQEAPRFEKFRAEPPPMMAGPSMIPPFAASPISRPPPTPLSRPSTKAHAVSSPPPKKSKSDVIDRPPDATIVVFDKKYLSYAEVVERRLIEMNMTVDVVVCAERPRREQAAASGGRDFLLGSERSRAVERRPGSTTSVAADESSGGVFDRVAEQRLLTQPAPARSTAQIFTVWPPRLHLGAAHCHYRPTLRPPTQTAIGSSSSAAPLTSPLVCFCSTRDMLMSGDTVLTSVSSKCDRSRECVLFCHPRHSPALIASLLHRFPAPIASLRPSLLGPAVRYERLPPRPARRHRCVSVRRVGHLRLRVLRRCEHPRRQRALLAVRLCDQNSGCGRVDDRMCGGVTRRSESEPERVPGQQVDCASVVR